MYDARLFDRTWNPPVDWQARTHVEGDIWTLQTAILPACFQLSEKRPGVGGLSLKTTPDAFSPKRKNALNCSTCQETWRNIGRMCPLVVRNLVFTHSFRLAPATLRGRSASLTS